MRIFPNTTRWMWRAWPVFTIITLGMVHYFLLNCPELEASHTNEIMALATQLIGGVLVLYSIDSTIGIIKGSSLTDAFMEYLRECPLGTKRVAGTLSANVGLHADVKATLTTRHNPKTIEEKVEYLQNQINEIKENLREELGKMNVKIDKQSKKFGKKIETVERSVFHIESKVTEVTVGGVKIQIQGVLLLVYGAITAYVA